MIGRRLPATLIVALVASTCTSGDGDRVAEPTTTAVATTSTSSVVDIEPAPEPVAIAVVAPSAVDDQAWTQSMVESLERVALSRPASLEVSANQSAAANATAAAREHADNGADLVILHGVEYGRFVDEIARDYPDVAFAFGTSTDVSALDNVFSYAPDAAQGGYVNGVIAAELTSAGMVGVIAPLPVGDAEGYVEGFRAGAFDTDPNVNVDVEYIESFDDVQLAAEAAQAQINRGADVLTGTSQMVVGAIAVAAEANVAWLANQSDASGRSAPGAAVVVASQVYRWDGMINEMLDRISDGDGAGDGDGDGKQFVASLGNGGLAIVFSDTGDVPSGLIDRATEVTIGIVDGSIEVPGLSRN